MNGLEELIPMALAANSLLIRAEGRLDILADLADDHQRPGTRDIAREARGHVIKAMTVLNRLRLDQAECDRVNQMLERKLA